MSKEIEKKLENILRPLSRDFQTVYNEKGGIYRAVYEHGFSIGDDMGDGVEAFDSHDYYTDYTLDQIEEIFKLRAKSEDFIANLNDSLNDALTESYSESWFNYMTDDELKLLKEAFYDMPNDQGWQEDDGIWNAWVAMSGVIARYTRHLM